MRRPAFGTLVALLTASSGLSGEAAIARARAIKATVSPSGKVLRAPTDSAPIEHLAEAAAPQAAICLAAEPLPTTAARDLVEKIAHDENFYPDFVVAVARAESHFRSDAVSPRGAIGLMQLEPETAKHYGVDICNPADNVRGGVRFLRDLHSRYRNPVFILAAYNAGEKALAEHNGVPPFAETVSFVAAVLNDFYDWPKVGGKARIAHGASILGAGQRAENSSKDEHWRSGFVWNVELNGESE
ncbi:lytic transglycosylase domain-containing protein [Methylocystis iwaonis]|uniref:lytic transglycosylase domain-containing protein n=1 Tax=Methylocystis iwaonis TaxID=2885079 RepID=UPI002E7C4C2B|nr:lytic transglycosylase domain-containing protein [Methylocystis iwaonis]